METAGEADDVGSLGDRNAPVESPASTASAPPLKNWVRDQFARRQIRNQPNEFGSRPRSEAADGDRLELFGQRRDITRMRVAEACDRDAGVQVQIGMPVEIRERRSASALDRELREQRDRLQSRRDELLFFIEERFRPRPRTSWVSAAAWTRLVMKSAIA